MTDMGRIYMTLGAPRSHRALGGTRGLHPTQAWFYYGDAAKGLPANFVMVFVQRGGGEFKLYHPVSDGPGSLLIETYGVDMTDHETLYEKIRQMAPTLARVTLSPIPNQIPYGYAPSPQTSLILAKVFDSPKKDINPAYATHFLQLQGDRQHGVPDELRRERRDRRDRPRRPPGHGLPPFLHLAQEGVHRLLRAQGPVLLQFQAQRQPAAGRRGRLPVHAGLSLLLPARPGRDDPGQRRRRPGPLPRRRRQVRA